TWWSRRQVVGAVDQPAGAAGRGGDVAQSTSPTGRPASGDSRQHAYGGGSPGGLPTPFGVVFRRRWRAGSSRLRRVLFSQDAGGDFTFRKASGQGFRGINRHGLVPRPRLFIPRPWPFGFLGTSALRAVLAKR